MLDHEQISELLKSVDQKLRAGFAARCNLRLLPLLVAERDKQFFDYWPKKEISKNLLSVLIAQHLAVVGKRNSHGGSLIAAVLVKDRAFMAGFDSASRIASEVIDSVSRASTIGFMTDSEGAIAVSNLTIPSANKVIGMHPVIEKLTLEIQLDLSRMKEVSSQVNVKEMTSEGFFCAPLWEGEAPSQWKSMLDEFKQALIDLDEGFEIWVDWYESRLSGIPLNNSREASWLDIPPEVFEQGAKASNAYLSSLDLKTLSPLNLVRAIFIGDGAVGKTSLIRRIHGESVLEGKEIMTPGIDIKQWELPESDIKARFWDFGGQVMSHSMHQFFLRERCLYILLVDAGSEREKREFTTANDRAEYWLEHIKVFGNSAPVMLVGNKAEKEKVDLDMNALKERYPNIIDFYPVSCTSHEKAHLSRFDVFHDDLVRQLKAVDTHQVMFTPNQFKMLEQLREQSRTQAFLDHSVFDDLCKQHEIGKVGLDQSAFLGLLDSLGEIIHFPSLAWSEAYVLNPRWLTYGVYTLLYAQKTEDQFGLLSDTDVIEILQCQTVEDELGNVLKYPKDKCRFIVDAMVSFGLCYRIAGKTNKDEGYLVIPDRLPKNQPDLSSHFPDIEGALAFEFDFDGLLPRSIMPNLIVSRHTEILETKESNHLVWQRGVVLHSPINEAKARLQVDYMQRRLLLWVQGNGLKEYISVLRDEIHQLLSSLKGIEFTESVVLPSFARSSKQRDIFVDINKKETAPYKRLQKELSRRQRVTSSDSGIDYDLRKIMGFIMTEEERKEAGISYVFNAPVGAVGGAGNKHSVSGKVKISGENKEFITEFQTALSELMKRIQNHDADFEIKSDAYAELKQIREYLGELERSSPETQGKLLQALGSIKDGSLGALKLGNDLRDADDTIKWLMANAATLSTFLTGLSLPI